MAVAPACQCLLSLLIFFLPGAAQAAEQGAMVTKNPIRKVVTMLQEMKKQVTEEGEKEEKAFKEFMCYCKTGVKTLEESIEASKTKIATFEEQLKENLEKKKMTEAALKEHKDSRIEAKEMVAKATALREKELKAFHKDKSDYETNISAIKAAVAALEKGMGMAFLQSNAAKVISRFVMEKATMEDSTRQELLSFLSGSSSEDYAPKSGQIVGILKQMGDEMLASLEEATKAEAEAKKNYEEMLKAKTKEINTLTAQIEEEMMRLGELNVMLADAGNDLEETKETLKEDIAYLAELKKGCATKEAEWEERCKVRAEELLALAETIKFLNDDDALELFKKTLPAPSASFVQTQETTRAMKDRALSVLRAFPRGQHPELDLVMLAIQGKKIGFEKVIKLIDDMVLTLKEEQADDDKKKEYCAAEIDKTEDTKKELERAIEVSETAIEELQGAIATWKEEIEALKASIKALDKSVAEATKLRQEENAAYKELMTNNKAAKEILLWAKNRLNKFYHPKLYKPESLVQETAPRLVQVSAHIRSRRSDADADVAPPPPPETFGAYAKKGEESRGVIGMIDKLVTELDMDMKEAEVSEKDAQSDYETLMQDAGDKRTADSKALTDKTASLAEAEEMLQVEEEKKKGLGVEHMETMQILMNLHSECDWLLQYYDMRKAARTDEIEALGKAKDVLSGADYSLLQTRHKTRSFLGSM